MAPKTPRIKKPKAENRVFLKKTIWNRRLPRFIAFLPCHSRSFKRARFRSARGMTSCKKLRRTAVHRHFFVGIFAREPSHILWTGTLHNRFAWIIRNFAENLHKHFIPNLYRHLYKYQCEHLHEPLCEHLRDRCEHLHEPLHEPLLEHLCEHPCEPLRGHLREHFTKALCRFQSTRARTLVRTADTLQLTGCGKICIDAVRKYLIRAFPKSICRLFLHECLYKRP